MKELVFRQLCPDEISYELLCLADLSEEAIQDYVRRGTCYGGFADGVLIGQYVLLLTRPFTVELVNIAVKEPWQNQGIGKKMVGHAIGTARRKGFKTMEVGTGNAGVRQLTLYQKCGFTITHVDHDFFRRHYPEPFFENGIECRHMVRMSMDLFE